MMGKERSCSFSSVLEWCSGTCIPAGSNVFLPGVGVKPLYSAPPTKGSPDARRYGGRRVDSMGGAEGHETVLISKDSVGGKADWGICEAAASCGVP